MLIKIIKLIKGFQKEIIIIVGIIKEIIIKGNIKIMKNQLKIKR